MGKAMRRVTFIKKKKMNRRRKTFNHLLWIEIRTQSDTGKSIELTGGKVLKETIPIIIISLRRTLKTTLIINGGPT